MFLNMPHLYDMYLTLTKIDSHPLFATRVSSAPNSLKTLPYDIILWFKKKHLTLISKYFNAPITFFSY